jgi:hypothetical protein
MSESERVKNQTIDEWLNDYDGYSKMGIDELRAELRRVVTEKEKTRSKPQNNSMWLWLSQVAKILNDAGIDMVLFLEKIEAEETKIPVTKDSLHERFWKPIMGHMTNKDSTTKMSTKDPDMIYQVACRVLAETFGILPPAWPDRHGENER